MSLYDRITGKVQRTALRASISAHNLYQRLRGPARLQAALKNDHPASGFESVNAATPRTVEIHPSDADLGEVIFTCYFVHYKDPINNIVRRKADIEYIAPWYRSMERLGLTGIIIHDGIDPDFIARYQTDRIRFRKFTGGNYSIFEERWMAYYLFLSQTRISRAFFTDINDVYITRSPFHLIDEQTRLLVGRDTANRIKDSGWILAELAAYEEETGFRAPRLFHYQPMYNAGVVGGTRQVMLFFMSRIIDYTLRARSDQHKDMTLLNLCIYDHFSPPIDPDLARPRIATPEDDRHSGHSYLITGYPLNSRFAAYELNSDACFIHK